MFGAVRGETEKLTGQSGSARRHKTEVWSGPSALLNAWSLFHTHAASNLDEMHV